MKFKLVQKKVFPTKYAALTEKKVLSLKSNIAHLGPLSDDIGFIRARGRLSKPEFEFDTEKPLLLPSKHPTMQLTCLNVIQPTTMQVLNECDISYIKSSGYWASEIHCAALKNAAFLAGKTVRISRLHVWPILYAKM